MRKRILSLALVVALCFSLFIVPAKAAVVEGTSALAASALFSYATSTGVPLSVIEGGTVASSTAIISDFAAATGVSAAETSAAIAGGVTIGTGGVIILTAAAVALCAGIVAWIVSNRPSTSSPTDPVPLYRGSGIVQTFSPQWNTSVPVRAILVSDWFPVSSDPENGSVLGSFEDHDIVFVSSKKISNRTYSNFFTWNNYNFLYSLKPSSDLVADKIAFCFLSSSGFTENNVTLNTVTHFTNGSYRFNDPYSSVSSTTISRTLSPDLVVSKIVTPNENSYIQNGGQNDPSSLPVGKSLEIQLPSDFPLSVGEPVPDEIPLLSPWLDTAFGPDPLVTSQNAPNTLIDSPVVPDPDPEPEPIPDVDFDPVPDTGDDTPPPDDPDEDNRFVIPANFFLGVWHYVVEAFDYALPFLGAAVVAWNTAVPSSIRTVFYAAVVLAAVFGLIRRLME